MLWLADECVAAPLVAHLRQAGHDVNYVAEMAAGLDDREVIAVASSEGRILLTDDKDFGDLVFRHRYNVPGIVLMRVGSDSANLQLDRLIAVIEQYGQNLFGQYVVIEASRFRARSLQTISDQ